jgi:hypothetical protein
METVQTNEKKPLYKRKWVWVVGVIVILYVVGSNSTPSTPTPNVNNNVSDTPAKTPEPAEDVIKVTASKMIADYKANEISADATYKDKLVKVTGTVGSIAKDVLDNPYVTLTNETQYSLESVQCYFSKADQASLANVTKDTRITLQGRVSGKSLTNVLVKECSIVQQ